MIKVLFVCLGNICRSPLAEAIFKKLIKERGLEDKLSCDSAGTADYHIGELPDERTIANAKKNGLVLKHRGRQLIKSDFKHFDYIIAMDNSNVRHINYLRSSIKNVEAKIFLIRDFENSGDLLEVPDPYYGGEEGFQKVFEIIETGCNHLLELLKEKHGF